MGCEHSKPENRPSSASVVSETPIIVFDEQNQPKRHEVQQAASSKAVLKTHEPPAFNPKPLQTLPTLEQIGRQNQSVHRVKQRGAKQATQQKQVDFVFPRATLQKCRALQHDIPVEALFFINDSPLDPEERAIFVWRVVSSNYEQEDTSISLKACRQALLAVFSCADLVESWIQLQKQYFCITKIQFIRIFVALQLAPRSDELLRTIFTGVGLDNDVWNLFEFVNCQSLIRPCADTRRYDFQYFKDHIATVYADTPWLLKLFGVSVVPFQPIAQSVPDLSFMLARVQIIDDIAYLSALIMSLAAADSDQLKRLKYILNGIFGTNAEFLDYLLPEFPAQDSQCFSIVQSLYFNYIELDQLQYAFDALRPAKLLQMLRLAENASSYDVTATIIASKYPNLASFLSLSRFSARRRIIQNISAQSRTAQIVALPVRCLVEFDTLAEPDSLYRFVCVLCQATELPISQAVGTLEAVFGAHEQIRLFASQLAQRTDLVLEQADFRLCFNICKDFAAGRPFAQDYAVFSRCDLGVVVSEFDADDYDELRKQLICAAQTQEMGYLVDILRGIDVQTSGLVLQTAVETAQADQLLSSGAVPSFAPIFENIQSQDQLDECIEPFMQLIEAAMLDSDALQRLFTRFFACKQTVSDMLCRAAQDNHDAISALFVVAFYKSLGLSPLLHAISGDQFESQIANNLLSALGFSVNIDCADIGAYTRELSRFCDCEIVSLFSE